MTILSTSTQRDTIPIYQRIAAEARRQRAANATLQEIARHFGVTTDTVQRAVDPEYAERRKQMNNEARRRKRGSGIDLEIHCVDPRPSPDEAAAAIATIPKDTRPLTARLLGDPLPGRSALDKKGVPA